MPGSDREGRLKRVARRDGGEAQWFGRLLQFLDVFPDIPPAISRIEFDTTQFETDDRSPISFIVTQS